jgi:hypothetical protein
VLREVGWWPGRKTYVEHWIDHFEARGCHASDAVVEFLIEFGGLDFPHAGRGIDRAREAVVLNPILCDGDEDRFTDWSNEFGNSLFPIGILGTYLEALGMDEHSEIYLLGPTIASFGPMPGGFEGLILGLMPTRIDVDVED